MVKENYVITTAQKGAKPHWEFLRGLEKYCKANHADLLILPTNGKKTTSRRGKDNNDVEVLHEYLRNNFEVVEGDRRLNSKLQIRHFPVKAQQMIPLTSWGRFIQYDKSAIIASPKLMMKALPNSNCDLPKILMSTGAITRPHYKDNSWGTKAMLDHNYGAIITNIENSNDYHYRQIVSNKGGTFFDLGKKYEGENKPSQERLEAMVLGDLHSGWENAAVMKATYAQIRKLQPKYVVVHDLFDGRAVSHHTQDQLITLAQRNEIGKDSLYDELKACGALLRKIKKAGPSDMEVIVVKGNHDEHLERYLQEGRFAKDPTNLELSAQLVIDMINGEDVIENGIGYTYGDIEGVRYLGRHDDFKKLGWQLGTHGDLGGNGSRGSVRTIENQIGKGITAHSHTPEIFRQTWRVGTSTELQMLYNRGASSWMNTHGLLHPNGKAQLINIIDGKYK